MNFLTESLQNIILVSSAVLSAYFPGLSDGLPVQPIQSDVIVRSGEYSYAGQTLKYTVNIPKNGGQLKGKLTGVCNGTIKGYFKGSPSYGIDDGVAEARCPVLLNKKLSVTYVAHIILPEGWARIDWMGNLPYTSGKGTFTTSFEPAQ